jgi:hypothetical protein
VWTEGVLDLISQSIVSNKLCAVDRVQVGVQGCARGLAFPRMRVCAMLYVSSYRSPFHS